VLAWAEPARVHFSGSAVGVGVTVHPPRRALKPTLGQGGALAHPACQRCFLRRSRCRRIGRASDAGKSGYASSAARGHSCPQQLPNALSSPENSRTLSSLKLSADRNVRAPLNRYKTGAANKSCSRTGARKPQTGQGHLARVLRKGEEEGREDEVADAAGYAIPVSFRHAFKAHEGLSPDAWRAGQ